MVWMVTRTPKVMEEADEPDARTCREAFGRVFGARPFCVRVLLVYRFQGLEDLTRQSFPVLARSLKPKVSGIFFASFAPPERSFGGPRPGDRTV